MSSTTYSIQVAAVNTADTGVYSDPEIRETFPSRPVVLNQKLFSGLSLISGVYLSLKEEIIPNHGYVDINDIGSIDPTALHCNTNRGPGGNGDSGGYWVTPDGTIVGNINNNRVPGFVRNRGSMVVRLLRDTGPDPAAEGIYRSSILDAERNNQIVYVGLYNTGNGSLWNL